MLIRAVESMSSRIPRIQNGASFHVLIPVLSVLRLVDGHQSDVVMTAHRGSEADDLICAGVQPILVIQLPGLEDARYL